jgi:hypothetical protein
MPKSVDVPVMAKRRTSRAGGRKSGSKASDGPGFLTRMVDQLTPGTGVRIAIQALGWTGLLVGIGMGTVLGLPELEQRAMARDQALPGDLQVVLPEPGWYAEHPEWTLPEVRRALQGLVVESVDGHSRSPRVRDGLTEAHQRLNDTHWFRRIDRLRWIDPRTIVVDGEWERPAAWVEADRGGRQLDLLVGTDGRRLPLEEERNDQRPRITGVDPGSIPEVGGDFGEDVLAALALHRLLAPFDWNDQISSIDVSGLSSSEGLVIRTNQGCSIVWGASPEARIDASEVTIRQKLDFLDYFDRNFGRIDARCSLSSGLGRIDLRIDYALWMAIDGDTGPSTTR